MSAPRIVIRGGTLGPRIVVRAATAITLEGEDVGGRLLPDPIGDDGQFLGVVAGEPAWVDAPDVDVDEDRLLPEAPGTDGQHLAWDTGAPVWEDMPEIPEVPEERLLPDPVGDDGQVLTVVEGAPAWSDPAEAEAEAVQAINIADAAIDGSASTVDLIDDEGVAFTTQPVSNLVGIKVFIVGVGGKTLYTVVAEPDPWTPIALNGEDRIWSMFSGSTFVGVNSDSVVGGTDPTTPATQIASLTPRLDAVDTKLDVLDEFVRNGEQRIGNGFISLMWDKDTSDWPIVDLGSGPEPQPNWFDPTSLEEIDGVWFATAYEAIIDGITPGGVIQINNPDDEAQRGMWEPTGDPLVWFRVNLLNGRYSNILAGSSVQVGTSVVNGSTMYGRAMVTTSNGFATNLEDLNVYDPSGGFGVFPEGSIRDIATGGTYTLNAEDRWVRVFTTDGSVVIDLENSSTPDRTEVVISHLDTLNGDTLTLSPAVWGSGGPVEVPSYYTVRVAREGDSWFGNGMAYLVAIPADNNRTVTWSNYDADPTVAQVLDTDFVLAFDTNGGPITADLSTLTQQGRSVVFDNVGVASNELTLDATIDGVVDPTVADGESRTVYVGPEGLRFHAQTGTTSSPGGGVTTDETVVTDEYPAVWDGTDATKIKQGAVGGPYSYVRRNSEGVIAPIDIDESIARDDEVATAIADAMDDHEAAADPHPAYLLESAATSGYQPLDDDLTDFAALTPTDDDVLVRVSGAWANRTPAQLKTLLDLASGGDAPYRPTVNSYRLLHVGAGRTTASWGGSAAAAANKCVYTPFYVARTTKTTALSLDITTAAANGSLRLGIFSDDGGVPGTVVCQSTVALTSNNQREVTFTEATLAPGWYWAAAAAQFDGTGTNPAFASTGTSVPATSDSAPVGGTTWAPYLTSSSISGSFTNNPTVAISRAITVIAPLIWMKVTN